jgi:hypothetical protein
MRRSPRRADRRFQPTLGPCPLTLLAAFLILGGCDRDAPSGLAGSAAPQRSASPPALPGITAELDGKPLPLASVLVYSRGGAALQLSFSTHPMTCNDLVGEGTVPMVGETTVDVTLAPRLTPDGNSEWRVTRGRLGQVTRQGDLGGATVSAFDPRSTVKAELDVKLTFPPDQSKKSHTLRLAGRVDTEGCGLRPFSLEAKVRPQPDLRFELAGKAISVFGSSFAPTRDGGLELRLTSEPHACATRSRGSDVALTLELGPSGEANHLRIEGYTLARPLDQKLESGSFAVRIEARDAGTGARVELAGTTEVSGYRVVLDGVTDAERCPNPR